MRFLVDRCAGRRLAEWLRSEGHDVLEVGSLGPDPGDEEILGMAAEERRIVVTIDTDFGRLIFVEQISHSGIIRLPDVPAQRRIKLMEEGLMQHLPDLAAGTIITIRGERIRISKPAG
jgi:predicted nuclease of predicted toxin-antitoxin system